jgi:hypothetical protein
MQTFGVFVNWSSKDKKKERNLRKAEKETDLRGLGAHGLEIRHEAELGRGSHRRCEPVGCAQRALSKQRSREAEAEAEENEEEEEEEGRRRRRRLLQLESPHRRIHTCIACTHAYIPAYIHACMHAYILLQWNLLFIVHMHTHTFFFDGISFL